MGSIISELQKDVYRDDVSLSSILRQAHVVARKLQQNDFDEWIQNELNGYRNVDVPEYREVKGTLKAWNVLAGWVPVDVKSSEFEEQICTHKTRFSIPDIENLIKNPKSQPFISFPDEVNAEISQLTNVQTQYALFFAKSVFMYIISRVKNKVLDWTIQLGEKNVIGENMSLTQQEKGNTKEIISAIHVYGNANINNGKNEGSMVINQNFNYEIIEEKLTEIEKDIPKYNLDDLTKEELKELISDAKQKIKSKKSNSMIKSSLVAIKDFVVSTVSNVTAGIILAKLNGMF